MQKKLLGCALILILLVPLLASTRGGWSVTTVEELPRHLVAGEPVEITFAIRAHGLTLMNGLAPQLSASSADGAIVHAVLAEPKSPGRYRGTLTVPAAGDWTVKIATTYAGQTVHLLPLQAVPRGAKAVPVSTREQGRRLFVAKGCQTCHSHAEVDRKPIAEFLPDLTESRLAPEYLARLLRDPSIAPDRGRFPVMPNLELKPHEIEALVAFLTTRAEQKH